MRGHGDRQFVHLFQDLGRDSRQESEDRLGVRVKRESVLKGRGNLWKEA